jgi:ferric-dicitrate binding protein FerR (iron transport regulator)
MKNIYDILKKHFLGEASQKEESLINKYKKTNHLEYKMLQHLWVSNTDINVKNYNADVAWQRVLAQLSANQTKTISLYSNFRRIAAAAIILIAISFTFYYVNRNIEKEIVARTNLVEKSREIILSDGSKIWLNKNTQFSYPKKFKGDVRKVSLAGEAYFEIAKNPEKPFIIETIHSDITVLGTSFNINTNLKQTEIAVTTGKVNVKSNYDQSNVDLTPNFMAIVSESDLHKSAIKNQNYNSWNTGKFIFENTSLAEVVEDLNSFYNKQIIIKNQNTECSFTANFNNDNLSDILEILSLTCNIEITEKENNYEIQ